MKKADTPEKLSELKTERDDLSIKIKIVRKELFLANGVLSEREEIRRKLQAQRELEKRYLENEKAKSKNRNRSQER